MHRGVVHSAVYFEVTVFWFSWGIILHWREWCFEFLCWVLCSPQTIQPNNTVKFVSGMITVRNRLCRNRILSDWRLAIHIPSALPNFSLWSWTVCALFFSVFSNFFQWRTDTFVSVRDAAAPQWASGRQTRVRKNSLASLLLTAEVALLSCIQTSVEYWMHWNNMLAKHRLKPRNQ